MGKNQSLNLPFPLILASTSKYRKELFSQLGWEFEAMNPGVDEDKVKTTITSPDEIAMTLANYKAQAIFVKRPEACVIGSDQVCTLEGKLFGKPRTKEAAREQISLLQGKSHELLTAVVVIHPKGIERLLNRTVLHMRPMTLKEIHAYINEDLPLDCAGSYKLESRGLKLFEKIQMSDHTAIIGLPLIELTSTLLKLGYPL